MIIRPDGDALLFISQPDHARLAADAIAYWQADDFAAHPRRTVILQAAHEHDNGWIEEDAATHVDRDGTPLDFVNVPAHVRQRIWPRAVDRMAERNAYAAALIAQHAIAVYSASRSDEGWQGFFERMTERRDDLRARAGIAPPELDHDYRFVHAADRISLAFCTGWDQVLESYGRQIRRNGCTVVIAPDPFGGTHVPLRIEARRLRRRAYASPADLRAALDGAPVRVLEGEATGLS